jgi:alkyl hydroperoxide reductase subunit AhpC
VRTVLVIGPEKKIKLMGLPDDHGLELRRDPARGRFDATHRQVSTPVNWKHGDDVIIAGSVNDDDAKKLFPECWRSPKPYIRIVKQPA